MSELPPICSAGQGRSSDLPRICFEGLQCYLASAVSSPAPMLLAVFYIAIAAEFIPAIAGVRRLRSLDRPLLVLLVYLTLAAATDVTLLLEALDGIHNLQIIALFNPLEFSLIAYTFSLWHTSPAIARAIRWSIPAFVLIALLEYAICGVASNSNMVSKTIFAVVLVVLSSHMLVRLRVSDAANLLRDPKMWISGAVLLHFAVASVVYGASEFLLTIPAELAAVPWAVKATANTAACLMYAKGFLCHPTR